jgi:hypothetical protein
MIRFPDDFTCCSRRNLHICHLDKKGLGRRPDGCIIQREGIRPGAVKARTS